VTRCSRSRTSTATASPPSTQPFSPRCSHPSRGLSTTSRLPAVPLAGLSAWQGLFDQGRLEAGERLLVHGASGGVGHFAVQLARARGAEVVDAEVDLVFDTVGGETLARSGSLLREGGRIVSVAEEPPAELAGQAVYFIVEPNRDQLVELARLADEGELRPAIDSVFPLAEARAAFERLEARGKRGKVVLSVV
jgi:NADPH:quinone reductase-like Zn-dependent oxidoreductase